VQQTCEACGGSFEPKNTLGRYCKRADCVRARARDRKRRQLGMVVPMRPSEQGADSALVAAVRAELDDAGRTGSVLGQQALHIATRLEAGEALGSAVASLHKELRATMEAALKTAEVAGPVDELRRKRAERLANGA
jgi:hypothetical protein